MRRSSMWWSPRTTRARGVGRLILEGLLEKLPFDRIYLTSTVGNEPFYGKFGFLEQTNAIGLYTGNALTSAIQRGVLRPGDA